jgi:hypothetical protein
MRQKKGEKHQSSAKIFVLNGFNSDFDAWRADCAKNLISMMKKTTSKSPGPLSHFLSFVSNLRKTNEISESPFSVFPSAKNGANQKTN